MKNLWIGIGVALIAGATALVVKEVQKKKKYAEVHIDENGEQVDPPTEETGETEEIKEEDQSVSDKISAYVDKVVDFVLTHDKEFKAFNILGGALITVLKIRKTFKENTFQKDVMKTLNEIKEREYDRGKIDTFHWLSNKLRNIKDDGCAWIKDNYNNGTLYKVTLFKEVEEGGETA